MNKIKKIIIILSIILLLIIVAIGIYLKKENNNSIIFEDENADVEYVLEEKIVPIKNMNDFATIQYFIEKYRNIYEEQNSLAMINILDEEWKELQDTTINNVLQTLQQWQIGDEYIIPEVYVKSGYTFSKYFVEVKQPQKNTYFVISKDNVNFTFAIEPITNEQYIESVQKGIPKLVEKELPVNDDNGFEMEVMSEEDIVQEYLKQLQFYLLYDNETCYDLLEDEYKKERFGSYEEFQKYTEENKETISDITLMSYGIELGETYDEYTAVDTNDNYYIFSTTGLLDYKVQLDNYTITSDEFNERYKEASIEEKLFSNINLFYKMINTKDYRHAYSHLADGFKDNYFKTQDEFELYVRENFYNHNVVTLNNIEEKNGIYICTVSIKSDNSVSAQTMQKTIILQLGEENDFVLSFEI